MNRSDPKSPVVAGAASALRLGVSLAIAALLLAAALPPPAHADIAGAPSTCHALVNVRIVASPGAAPADGAIVIRDGRIESMGARARIPADAVVHDLTGRIVYPGLVEPYLRLPHAENGAAPPAASGSASPSSPAAAHENARIRPERRAVDSLPLPSPLLDDLRTAGYAAALVAPSDGIFRGTSAVVCLGTPRDVRATFGVVHTPDFAQTFAFEHGSWSDDTYPGSLMGTIALARQTLLDASWSRDAWRAWERNPGAAGRPEENVSLRALLPAVDRLQSVTFECEGLPMIERALRLAREFRLRPILVSGGADEWRRVEWLRAELVRAAAPLVVAVDFPEAPRWEDPEDRTSIELTQLVQWERAPAGLAALERAGIAFAVTSQGLEKRAQVLDRLREAIERGLTPRAALASVTTTPARLLGIEARAGTIAPGKDANLVVATRDLFERGVEIEETWIDGVRFGEDPKRASEANLAGKWDIAIGGRRAAPSSAGTPPEAFAPPSLRIELEKSKDAFTGKVVALPGETLAADSASADARKLRDVRLAHGTLEFTVGAVPGQAGARRFVLQRDGKVLRGFSVAPPAAGSAPDSLAVLARRAPKEAPFTPPLADLSADAPRWPPVAPETGGPRSVLVKGATIWTCGPVGVLEGADLLVQDGRIARVGKNLGAGRGALVIEAEGRHVTPGLIDCHSHSDISGGVNEGSNSCTAEVRIADVVDSESPAMYRELAGGLTVSNLLHGSANAIGGQNAVIKLRWGATADRLLFDGAPQGIKFALGENVKQSNWGEKYTTRYPQTRMGVEQLLRERFLAAVAYRDEWSAWRRTGRGTPPRRDLQLEALVEILEGRRLVHCHSYRADEILMLIRLAEELGFRVATFQHVLEGYKVADEIAAHGAGASGFSDWWSYKYEVVDAIPYLGEILWKRGVLTSYNSDSYDLARRLNLEAAKAVKYGGVPEEEALKFVTWNPAKQLGIEGRVGSLEPGKDADFVLWSGPPLSDSSVCLETWVDGRRLFSRAQDLGARARAEELRESLLAKAEKVRRAMEKSGEWKADGKEKKPAFGELYGEQVEDACGGLSVGDCILEEAACSGSH